MIVKTIICPSFNYTMETIPMSGSWSAFLSSRDDVSSFDEFYMVIFLFMFSLQLDTILRIIGQVKREIYDVQSYAGLKCIAN